jgi:hypothetical protein
MLANPPSYQSNMAKHLRANGQAQDFPSRNPNVTYSDVLAGQALSGATDQSYARHKEEDRFTSEKLGYKSIFDTVPSTQQIEHPVGIANGMAWPIQAVNDQLISAEGQRRYADGQLAQSEIAALITSTRAIREGNLSLAEEILRRPVTQEDIARAHSQTSIVPVPGERAPVGDTIKSFYKHQAAEYRRYLKGLKEAGINYTTSETPDKYFVTIHPEELAGDGKEDADDVLKKLIGRALSERKPRKTISDESSALDKVVASLSKKGIKQTNPSLLKEIRKPETIDLLREIGVAFDPSDNLTTLRKKLYRAVYDPDGPIFSRLEGPLTGIISRSSSAPSSRRGSVRDLDSDEEEKEDSGDDRGAAARSRSTPVIRFDDDEPSGSPLSSPVSNPVIHEEVGKGLGRRTKKAKTPGAQAISDIPLIRLKRMWRIYKGELEAGNDSAKLKKEAKAIGTYLESRGYLSRRVLTRIVDRYCR